MLVALSFGLTNRICSASASIDAKNYSSLSEKELGHVLWLVKLAQQPPGDWSYMGGLEEGQEGLEAYRYQLGYMAYALAIAQYHKTPAYREMALPKARQIILWEFPLLPDLPPTQKRWAI